MTIDARRVGRRAALLAAVLVVALVAACSHEASGPSDRAAPSTTTSRDAPAPSCGSDEPVRRSEHQYLDGPTGSDPDLTTLEVIGRPVAAGCRPRPAMLWIHGGGWSTGDRRNGLEDKVELFGALGWVLVPVNYRLSPEVTHPTHAEDVAAATAWVLEHADELGVDPARVSIMGHSAGAGIAASVLADERHLAAVGRSPDDLRCAVLLDTEGYDVEAAASRGSGTYLRAFGEDPERWADASPIRHLVAGEPLPTTLVVTRGTDRRRAVAAGFVDALRGAGAEASLLDARPSTHAEVNAAVGAPDDRLVTPALVEHLAAC